MRRNGKKIIALIIIITGLIGLGVYFFIQYTKVDPKKYYEEQMTNIATYLTRSVEKSKKNFTGTLSLKYIDKKTKDTSVNVNYSYNYERQKQLLNINLLYDKASIDSSVFIANDRAYFTLKNVLDKYYYLNLKDLQAYTQQSMPADFASAFTSGINVLKQTLNDSNYNFVSENGEQKVILRITEDKYVDFIKTYINNLRNNQEFVNNVSKVTDETNTQVRENLNKLLNEEYKAKNIVITSYLKNKKAYKIDINITNTEEKNNIIIDIINDKTYNIEIKTKKGETEDTVKVLLTKDNDNTMATITHGESSLNISNSVTYGKTLDDPNTSNSKDIETITEFEQQALLEKIYSNENIKDFIKTITDNIDFINGGFGE